MEKILVSDKISKDGLRILTEEGGFQVDFLPEITQEEIKKIIPEYTGWVVRSRSSCTPDIIERAEKLKVIGRAGVGLDNVNVEAATKRGVVVMNTPGGNTISTAEHTCSMLLSLARMIPAADASMRAGKWDKKSFMGVELQGKTLGVIGLGRIGQAVAKRMLAFEMRVLGYDPYITEERMRSLGICVASVDEICEQADFITVHTPLSDETRGIVNAARIAKMKKGVRVVNCARGGIIDEAALLEALQSGKVAGAALDVFEKEPLAADHAFRSLPNVVLTPHIAASTTEAQEMVAIQVARQIVDFLKNGTIVNAANAPSIEAELLAAMRPYLLLTERLGKFLGQYVKERIKRLEVRVSGAAADYPIEPLTTAAAKGFLELRADSPVNYGNAFPLAHARGIEVVASRHSEPGQYTNLITIEAVAESGEISGISGTLFTRDMPRIVMFNQKHFNAVPEGNLIVLENRDVPGIIGAVGTLLGNRAINIGQMTWGRRTSDNMAMTIINVDNIVSPEVLQEVAALPNVMSARLIRLSAERTGVWRGAAPWAPPPALPRFVCARRPGVPLPGAAARWPARDRGTACRRARQWL